MNKKLIAQIKKGRELEIPVDVTDRVMGKITAEQKKPRLLTQLIVMIGLVLLAAFLRPSFAPPKDDEQEPIPLKFSVQHFHTYSPYPSPHRKLNFLNTMKGGFEIP